jgi:hypothetical protein
MVHSLKPRPYFFWSPYPTPTLPHPSTPTPPHPTAMECGDVNELVRKNLCGKLMCVCDVWSMQHAKNCMYIGVYSCSLSLCLCLCVCASTFLIVRVLAHSTEVSAGELHCGLLMLATHSQHINNTSFCSRASLRTVTSTQTRANSPIYIYIYIKSLLKFLLDLAVVYKCNARTYPRTLDTHIRTHSAQVSLESGCGYSKRTF